LQPTLAQGAAAQPSANIIAGQLEEVVVTAQKRKESLQETPLAVSAITSELLEQRGTVDVSQLTSFAPNLTTTTTPGSTSSSTIAIRAIGNGDPILTSDSPVALYVDGVVIGRQAGAAFDLIDLERIEVLRGPQGTLYGRNTIGGAVNLITAKPADNFGIKQKFSFGNWSQWQTRTSLDTGQWGESGLRAKLTYVHREQDGFVDNLNAPGDLDPGAFELDAGRIALSFDRGGAFRADYAFDHNKREGIPMAWQATVANPAVRRVWDASPGLGGRAPQVSASRLDRLYLDVDEPNTDEVDGHSLTLEFDLSANTMLRSLTGYREWSQITRNTSMDGQNGIRALTLSPRAVSRDPAVFALIPTGEQEISLFGISVSPRSQHQVSQELNLIAEVNERLTYIAGLFYFKEKSREYSDQFVALALPEQLFPLLPLYGLPSSYEAAVIPLPPSSISYTHESESRAAFAQATYDLTDRLSFTGGVRYTEDEKTLNQVAPFLRNPRKDFSRFNWSATLDYKVNDDVMTYARAATGYKAGGMNARSVNDGYKPEDLISFELGAKSELLDRRLRLNGAIFFVDHEDMQLQQFVAGSGGALSNTVNAGKAEYKGVELEFDALLADGLTFSGALGYIDREFKEFWIVDPVTSEERNVADSAHFTYSARETASAALQYNFPRHNIGQLSGRLEYNYRGKVYFQPTLFGTPLNESIPGDSRSLLDARLTLSEVRLGGLTASLALWGKNLTDEEYRIHGIDFGALGYAGNVYGEPRSYGLDISISFQRSGD
jgi:iron complex outermembrane receptor protein